MRKFFIFLVLLAGVSSYGSLEINVEQKEQSSEAKQAQTPEKLKWDWNEAIEKTESGTIYFKSKIGEDPSPILLNPIKTRFVSLEIISLLTPESTEEDKNPLPFYLFSALPCEDCQETKRLYIVRADGKYPLDMVYPGVVRNPKRGNRIELRTRAFYGKCLRKAKGDVLVFFNEEKLRRRRYLQQSVFVATPKEDRIDEKLIIRRRSRPRLKHTVRYVKQKKCKEILGMKRKTKSFQLKNNRS